MNVLIKIIKYKTHVFETMNFFVGIDFVDLNDYVYNINSNDI